MGSAALAAAAAVAAANTAAAAVHAAVAFWNCEVYALLMNFIFYYQ